MMQPTQFSVQIKTKDQYIAQAVKIIQNSSKRIIILGEDLSSLVGNENVVDELFKAESRGCSIDVITTKTYFPGAFIHSLEGTNICAAVLSQNYLHVPCQPYSLIGWDKPRWNDAIVSDNEFLYMLPHEPLVEDICRGYSVIDKESAKEMLEYSKGVFNEIEQKRWTRHEKPVRLEFDAVANGLFLKKHQHFLKERFGERLYLITNGHVHKIYPNTIDGEQQIYKEICESKELLLSDKIIWSPAQKTL